VNEGGNLLLIRLVLLIFLLACLAIGVAAVLIAIRSFSSPARATQRDTMPETFQRAAYVMLIVLLFGVTSGWLGGV